MSDITENIDMMLTANKKQRKPYTVKVLKGVGPTKDPIDDLKKEFEEKIVLIPEEDAQRAKDYIAKNSTAQDYAGVLKKIDRMIDEIVDESPPEDESISTEEVSEETPDDSDSSPEEDLF